MREVLIILFLNCTLFSFSQQNKIENSWSGNFDLGLNFTKNIEETFQFNNIFKINYKSKKYTIYLNNSTTFISKTDQEELLNKGAQDLKYEVISKNLKIGLSFQHLYDISRKIKNRYTSGIGLSYSVLEKKNINLGLIIQREKENILEGEDKLKNRLNSNILFTKKIKEAIEVTLKNSYQPNLVGFGDFRWVSNLSLRINLSTNFLLSINTTYNYDSTPEIGIPEADYQLINSVSYSF